MLNSDELGDIGQARFRELCSGAKLICNPSTERDRAGWDFLVEFPFDPPTPSMTLDKRRSPTSCYVQVKTMWSHNDTFKLRLSSAERLAKEPKPSFIYVLRVDKNLQFIDSYLLHIFDANLAKILKRLRAEHAKGRTAANQSFISYSIRDAGQPVQVTAAALRIALAQCCGPSMEAYMKGKVTQRETLGFELKPYEFSVTLKVDNDQDLVEGFLGQKPINVLHAAHYETRFDIKLPVALSDGGNVVSIKIQPQPIAQCRIVVSPGGLVPSSVFDGEIFAPDIARLRLDLLQFVIRSRFLTITIRKDSSTFSVTPEGEGNVRELKDWIDLLRVYIAFSQPGGRLSIVSSILNKTDIVLGGNNTEAEIESLELHLELVEGLHRLIDISGAKSCPIDMRDVEDAAHEILFVTRNLVGRLDAPPLAFNVEPITKIPVSLADQCFLYTNFIIVGQIKVAYSALIEFSSIDTTEWHVEKVRILSVSSLDDDFMGNYQKFIASQRAEAPTQNVLIVSPRKTE